MNLFKSINKQLAFGSRNLKEAETLEDAKVLYKKAYGKELDLSNVPCVIAKDNFMSGWGGADGKTAFDIVLCGSSVEAANIEYEMKSVAAKEGLSRIRRSFGVKIQPGAVPLYVIGKDATAWGGGKVYESNKVVSKSDDIDSLVEWIETDGDPALVEAFEKGQLDDLIDPKTLAEYKKYVEIFGVNPGSKEDEDAVEHLNVLYKKILSELKKLQSKDLKESEGSIYEAIEEALWDAGFNVRSFREAGLLTHNIGWVVSKDGESAQLSCLGSYDESCKKDLGSNKKSK